MGRLSITVTVDEIIEKGCVDVQETARILGCSISTVYDLLNDRSIPYVRVRSGKKIPLAGIEKYIASRLTQG